MSAHVITDARILVVDDQDSNVQLLDRLLRIMDNVWGFSSAAPNFDLRPSYDPALPPHLLVRTRAFPAGTPITPISPRKLPTHALRPGDAVLLSGFAVQKVDPLGRAVTLRVPAGRPGAPAFGVRLRIPPFRKCNAAVTRKTVTTAANNQLTTKLRNGRRKT